MKLAPARQAAFGALLAVERGAWSAEALAAKSAHLDARDAGLALDIVFGTLRRRGEIDFIIAKFSKRPVEQLDPIVRIAIEMGIYQLWFLDRVPAHAAVNDSVELARRAGKASASAFVNAVLRRALREQIVAPAAASTPSWLMERWISQYGPETAKGIAQASLTTPERYIRVGDGTRRRGPKRLACRVVTRFPWGIRALIAFRTSVRRRWFPCSICSPGTRSSISARRQETRPRKRLRRRFRPSPAICT